MPRKSNPDVRKAFEQIPMTPEQLDELYKCYDDPLYCIKNYFKIRHPTKGLVKFDMYDYQEEVIRRAQKNRFNVILFPRQSGKCCQGNTTIYIRNDKTDTLWYKFWMHILLKLI